MTTFPTSVERWRPVVQSELARLSLPLPVELVLAVIKKESGGRTSGISSVGASGLMQVMKGTLGHYNKVNGKNYTVDQLRGSSPADAMIQIRVGLWVLKTYWKSAYRYLSGRTKNIGIDTLSKIASIFYVAGPGNGRKKLDKVSPSYESLAAKYPNWSPIKNGYATKIWGWANDAGAKWDHDSINRWLGGDGIDGGDDDDPDSNDDDDNGQDSKKTKSGALLALLIMFLCWNYMKGNKK